MIIDTNVFVDFLRGEEKARAFFETTRGLQTSVICVMELLAGLPKISHIKTLEKTLDSMQVRILPITGSISHRAYQLYRREYHVNSITIPDAFVIATAIEHAQLLVTLDKKHMGKRTDVQIMLPY